MECLISVETRIIQLITKVNMFYMLRGGSTLIRAGAITWKDLPPRV